MTTLLWRLAAFVLASEWVRGWIIRRAMRTPYHHITNAAGDDTYMERYWLFNPYPSDAARQRFPRLPSARVHHIRQPDQDRHVHNHPWDARTIILSGCYVEHRLYDAGQGNGRHIAHTRTRGGTATLKHGEYHRIVAVSDPPPITLFITWGKRSSWGFLVDGKHVPWREYTE